MKTVAIATLGCKVNQYDSAALAGLFSAHGYQVVDFAEPADVYIINTCTVTHIGDRKSRQLIRRAKKKNPDAFVVVTGCYAQVSPREVMAIPGINLVIGTTGRACLVDLVERAVNHSGPINCVQDIFTSKEFEEISTPTLSGRGRAFLKIQEGCSNYCTYCIVPYTRGFLRSRQVENILSEARRLITKGFKEIVITGIQTGAYGADLKERINLAGLLDLLVELPGLARIRLSSVEPLDVTEELIELVARKRKICRHFHIPLQSGDDLVLKRMNRHYTTDLYKKLIHTIYRKVSDVAVTTDVMVGFPDESEEQFFNTYHFVEEMAFSKVHVFKYSPRKGTRAAKMRVQVPFSIKEKRSKLIIALGDKLSKLFAQNFLGKQVEVLVERLSKEYPGYYEGLTSNYLRVIFPACIDLRGQLVKINVCNFDGAVLKGSLV